MTAAIIEARDLVKRFDGFTAVDHISFAVEAGVIFGFLGPNGAGKTTTIKMLTTVLTPSEGRLSIAGHDPVKEVYSADDPHAFYRLLYFSFTTLTTAGYGDITPVTDQARSFVMIEQFSGVFFVGILIARLAGLYPPQKI
jgi:ABC-type branched-subunit amino acid transport system ATPase component